LRRGGLLKKKALKKKRVKKKELKKRVKKKREGNRGNRGTGEPRKPGALEYYKIKYGIEMIRTSKGFNLTISNRFNLPV
jgi:hypothetical protein